MISIVIPTLNEKRNISRISNKLYKIKFVSEIIFVDDNSTDGTFKELIKLRKFKKFKVFLRKKKIKDLSKSVLYGVKKSSNKTVIVMDCDLQHDTKYIKSLWKLFRTNKSDLIVASRFKKRSFFANVKFFRTLVSKFAIFLINFVFGYKTSDPLSGFFICERNLILKYKKNFFLNGYKILFDIIYNSKKNISVKDLEINFKGRKFEKSKFNIRIISLFLKQMFFTKFVVKN